MRVCNLFAGVLLVAVGLSTPAGGQQRVAVLTEPGTPVVATELLVAVGPAQEDAARAGIAYLAARSLVREVRPALDTLGATIAVTPEKDALSISVVAAPDAWEAATRAVVLAVFRDRLASSPTLAERSAIASELRGRLANPADAADREMDRAFFGTAHPWGRPTVGTPETIERLTVAQVDTFARQHFTVDRAFIAVVGPVEADEVQRHFRPLLGSGSPAPLRTRPFRPVERPVRREYNSITTWVGASFGFPETGDLEALRFLAYLAAETLSFSPTQRSVYDVWTDVVPRAGGGEIRLQVVIPPQEADEWAERMEGAMDELATRSMPADVLEGHLRRYRGLRLMRLSAPEDRAGEAARQLLVSGRLVGIIPDLDEITSGRIQAAAGSLDSPTIVLLGPTLDGV